MRTTAGFYDIRRASPTGVLRLVECSEVRERKQAVLPSRTAARTMAFRLSPGRTTGSAAGVCRPENVSCAHASAGRELSGHDPPAVLRRRGTERRRGAG